MLTAIFYNNLGPYHITRIEALRRILQKVEVIELGNQSAIYKWRSASSGKDERITLFSNVPAEEISKHEIYNVLKVLQTFLKLLFLSYF